MSGEPHKEKDTSATLPILLAHRARGLVTHSSDQPERRHNALQEAEGHQLWHENARVWRVMSIQDPTEVTRSIAGRKAGEQVARWSMRGLLEGLERVPDLEPYQEGYNQIKECSAKTGVDEMGRRSIDERQSKATRYSIQSNCCSYRMA